MRHIRAILILLHLFAINIVAFPTPRGNLGDKHVQKPDVQESIKLWHSLLFYESFTGRNKDEFARDLVSVGHRLVKTQKAVTKPFIPYYKYAGTRQSWQMFGYVQHSSGHLHIELKENGEWRALYVDLDSNHQWNSHLLNQERTRAMRSLFAQKRFHTRYKRFAAWLSKEAFTEFPEAQAFRTFYQQQTVPKPKVLQKSGRKLGTRFWETTFEQEKP